MPRRLRGTEPHDRTKSQGFLVYSATCYPVLREVVKILHIHAVVDNADALLGSQLEFAYELALTLRDRDDLRGCSITQDAFYQSVRGQLRPRNRRGRHVQAVRGIYRRQTGQSTGESGDRTAFGAVPMNDIERPFMPYQTQQLKETR